MQQEWSTGDKGEWSKLGLYIQPELHLDKAYKLGQGLRALSGELSEVIEVVLRRELMISSL